MNVFVSTQSAMFDRNSVKARAGSIQTVPLTTTYSSAAGCIGAFGAKVADAQITQMFKALLVRRNLQRVAGRDGKLTRIGPFPAHLFVQYDP